MRGLQPEQANWEDVESSAVLCTLPANPFPPPPPPPPGPAWDAGLSRQVALTSSPSQGGLKVLAGTIADALKITCKTLSAKSWPLPAVSDKFPPLFKLPAAEDLYELVTDCCAIPPCFPWQLWRGF